MEITFDKRPAFQQIRDLFNSVEWSPRSEEEWAKVLDRSTLICTAWERESLVGLGRLVEDGRYAMIYDLVVHKDHQGKGLGKEIAKALVDRSIAKYVGLFTEGDDKLMAFYGSLGFESIQGMQLNKGKPKY